MLGVQKRIHGDRGETRLGPLPGFPFRVDGRALRQRRLAAAGTGHALECRFRPASGRAKTHEESLQRCQDRRCARAGRAGSAGAESIVTLPEPQPSWLTPALFVEQGYAKFGEVVPDLTLLVPFTTSGLPGDSGSGVMNDAGLAVGDLTHGISVAGLPVPGLSFGTDMTEIFGLIGSSYKLVTAAGLRADCAHPVGV